MGLVVYTVFSNIFSSLGSDVLMPFCAVNIQNNDTKLKYGIVKTHAIIQLYYLGYCISGYLSMYMLFTQIDFLIIETVVYGISTYCTTIYYINTKKKLYYNNQYTNYDALSYTL